MVFAEGDGGEKTVVKFQTWNPGDEEYTHAMLEKFEEEHPDIQIDYTFMPYTDHVEKLKVDLSAGDAADVYGVQTLSLIHILHKLPQSVRKQRLWLFY